MARTDECAIFEESFGNHAAQMTTEYGPYEMNSRFLLIADRRHGLGGGGPGPDGESVPGCSGGRGGRQGCQEQ